MLGPSMSCRKSGIASQQETKPLFDRKQVAKEELLNCSEYLLKLTAKLVAQTT